MRLPKNPIARIILPLAILTASCMSLTGCMSWLNDQFRPDSDIWNIGNARQITQWALRQTDWLEVSRAMFVLRTISLGDPHTRPSQKQQAIDGYVQLYEKFAAPGPDDAPVLPPAVGFASWAQACYVEVADGGIGYPDDTSGACAIFFRIKPPPTQPERLKEWTHAGLVGGLLQPDPVWLPMQFRGHWTVLREAHALGDLDVTESQLKFHGLNVVILSATPTAGGALLLELGSSMVDAGPFIRLKPEPLQAGYSANLSVILYTCQSDAEADHPQCAGYYGR